MQVLGSARQCGNYRLVESKARPVAQLEALTQSISLRLPVHTLERIKAAANARDVPYQSLIKVWLEEKLSTSQSRVRDDFRSRSRVTRNVPRKVVSDPT